MSTLDQEREQKLTEVKRKEEEEQTERLAQKAGAAYVDLTLIPVQRDSLAIIPQAEAERSGAVVIQKSGQNLKVGLLDPANQETLQVLERLKSQSFKVEVLMISRSSFKKALGEFKFIAVQGKGAAVSGEVSLEQIEALKKELTTFAALKNKIAAVGAGDTSLLLEVFLSAALNLDASDVHIEPQQNQTQIRFRLDGILQDTGNIAPNTYHLILSRVKLLSGLQLNVKDVPQDGRFTIKEGGLEVEVRTSILPGAYGEYIVLRILNPNAVKLEVKDLGLRDWLWQILEREIKKPTGIILVTGPTGSGKTTTLYGFLKTLNQPGVKIVTLEDPIEYHLTGINQSQIEAEKGYTFAQGLRSVLRQDPNIILVGEIRDEETADVALHAALTGHLVFSTLHTNNAVGAIPRFLDLNAKPPILASALNLVIAQRLVRRLCPQCKKEANLDPAKMEQIKKELYDSKFVEDIFPWPEPPKTYQAVGCERCGGTGYKGRIGVFEVLAVDSEMEKLIGQSPTHQLVFAQAKKAGFVTMYQDGLMRVLEGETTLEEIERVTSAAV